MIGERMDNYEIAQKILSKCFIVPELKALPEQTRYEITTLLLETIDEVRTLEQERLIGKATTDDYNAYMQGREDAVRKATAKEIFDEIEKLTLECSGTCNNPFCHYGDEAEEEYAKFKSKYLKE